MKLKFSNKKVKRFFALVAMLLWIIIKGLSLSPSQEPLLPVLLLLLLRRHTLDMLLKKIQIYNKNLQSPFNYDIYFIFKVLNHIFNSLNQRLNKLISCVLFLCKTNCFLLRKKFSCFLFNLKKGHYVYRTMSNTYQLTDIFLNGILISSINVIKIQ